MIQPESQSLDFIDNASRRLTVAGAQTLRLAALSSTGPPGWDRGWARILLTDTPGAATVYAFTEVDGNTLEELRTRVDRLADGISALGLLQGPLLRLVVIAVFPAGMGAVRARAVTAITPRYVPGLRPQTWAADLRTGTLHRGRMAGSGADAVAAALDRNAAVEVLDASGVAIIERENAERTAAFYRLMRTRQPVVTYSLLAVNIAIFGLMYLHGSPTSDATLQEFGALSPRLIEQGQWWRLCTAIFLHAGIAHILFNMTSLFMIGILAERLYGSARYLAIYLGAGLLGSIASFSYAVLTGNVNVLGVGASGAIFGLAAALMTTRFQRSDVIPLQLRQRISTSLLPIVLLNLGIAYFSPHIDNSAHIGGLAGGILLSFLFPLARDTSEVR